MGHCVECGGDCDASFQPRAFEVTEMNAAVCDPSAHLNGIAMAYLDEKFPDDTRLGRLKVGENAQYWCNGCFTEETGRFVCTERADWEAVYQMNVFDMLAATLVFLAIGMEVASEAREVRICIITRRRILEEAKEEEKTGLKTWCNACLFL